MPYSGPDRREIMYCNTHEQNTKDITALKTRISVWQGIIGGILTIGLFVVGYMLNESNAKLDKIYFKLDNNAGSITRLEEQSKFLDTRVSIIEAKHIRDEEKIKN